MVWHKALAILVCVLCQSISALAAEISLNVAVSSRDDFITVTVTNDGRDAANELRIAVALAGFDTGGRDLAQTLRPGEQKTFQTRATLPPQRGSYPLITTVSYLNDGRRFSVMDVGHFYWGERRELPINCNLPELTVRGSKTFTLTPDPSAEFSLVLPPEVPATVRPEGSRWLVTLDDVFPGMQMNYGIFALYQNVSSDGVRGLKVCPTRLRTRGLKRSGLFGSGAYCFLLFAVFYFLGAFTTFAECSKHREPPQLLVSLTRFFFSGAVISFLFALFYGLWCIPESLVPLLSEQKLSSFPLVRTTAARIEPIVRWFYFDGRNYDHFNNYIAPALFAYMLTLNFFVVHFLVRPDPKTDKYWHLMLSCFSLLPFGRAFWFKQRGGKTFYWSDLSRVALLAICVKSFYVPVFLSWTINNFIHMHGMVNDFHWEFFWCNRFLIDAFILLDVSIFCLSYFSELPVLKNQIRSVEPTALGWFVCLICYPPFNEAFFPLFDVPITGQWSDPSTATKMAVQAVITSLWFVYLAATLALGLKASNLTHRGVVWRWPYSVVRHPAYASKVSLWILTSFFLNSMNGVLALTLIVVYSVRAYTEERHLSRDPEYVRYKQKVKWCAVPGVF